MAKANALSCCPDHPKGEDDNKDITLLPPSLFQIQATETFMLTAEEAEFQWHILECTDQDECVTKVLWNSELDPRFSDKWAVEDGLILHQGLVYIPRDSQLCHNIIQAHHDFTSAGHPG